MDNSTISKVAFLVRWTDAIPQTETLLLWDHTFALRYSMIPKLLTAAVEARHSLGGVLSAAFSVRTLRLQTFDPTFPGSFRGREQTR